MTNFITVSATAFALSASAAAAGVVNFDANATGFYGPNDGSQVYSAGSYQGTGINGLLFDTPILVNDFTAGTSANQTGNIGQQATPPFGGDPKGESFGGSFDGFTVSDFSVLVGDSGGDLDIFQLLGFDAGGNEIANSGEIRSLDATTISISATGIASFSLTIGAVISGVDTTDGSSFFDNIEFTEEVAVVPLPATLPLVGFGLLALGAAARRRKS